MEEETYVLCSYIFLAICVVLLAIFFFCCLGPLIVWFTGEDQDVPVTLRKSLRKSPFGQRSTPPTDESGFPSVVRRKIIKTRQWRYKIDEGTSHYNYSPLFGNILEARRDGLQTCGIIYLFNQCTLTNTHFFASNVIATFWRFISWIYQ